MADKRLHKNRLNLRRQDLITRSILIREKKLIESHYDLLICSITKNGLCCKGSYKPTSYSKPYSFSVTYSGKNPPDIHVTEPQINYHDDIHMYPKGESLCLYHPETDNLHWDAKKNNIYDTIIPWTLEWFVYYELYLITGKWEHPFKPHLVIKEK
jgi:hypothetical protein|tara:strand:- start:1080 stop:1544 length:465 start_codon:yes stop_codon:yes gene_type:complete